MSTKGAPPSPKPYQSRVSQRTSTTRTSNVGIPSFGGPRRISRSVEVSYGSPISPQSFTNVSSAGVNQVRSNRNREKKDMQDLNERLATYIETVKFHEAQNKKLAKELEDLRNKWGKETSEIKTMYEGEIAQLRKLLDESEKAKAERDLKMKGHDDLVNDLRRQLNELQDLNEQLQDRVDKQDQQLSDYEGEIAMLRRRRDNLEDEKTRNVREIARLQQELNNAKLDCDAETLARIDLENQVQTLKEEMEFMKDIYETQLKELAALAYRDTTAENREWWKNELAQCLREIQDEYENKIALMKTDVESFYKLKVQEIQTGAARNNVEVTHSKEENNRLKSTVSDLRSKIAELETRNAQLERDFNDLRAAMEERERDWDRERSELEAELREVRAHMESVLNELQALMDAKLSLELEIAAYSKLLEGEETRHGLRQVVATILDSHDMQQQAEQNKPTMVKGEMSAKTTFQRSAKGPVSITECNPEGKWVTIENTKKNDEKIAGWKLVRKVDGRQNFEYVFPAGTVIKPNKTIRIVAKGAQLPVGSGDLVYDSETWGAGKNVTTALVNTDGEERATHVQKTTYAA